MLESLEKLREDSLAISIDENDVATVYMTHGKGDFIRSAADAIQREVDERYMLLPVDADGVPIRVGDEVTYGVGQKLHCVYAVSDDAAWLNNSATVGVIALMKFQAEQCHHVKPRTVEDVLHDFILNESVYDDETYAKYADELREMIGGGE